MSTKSKSKGHASDANVDADYPSDFGIFYPTGSLMAGFPTEKQAIDIQKELIAGGKSVADCTLLSSEAILTAADHNLKMHDGFLARLGWSAKAVQIHLDLARENGVILKISVKDDEDSERTMEIIRHAPFSFVHRYHALAIEELQ